MNRLKVKALCFTLLDNWNVCLEYYTPLRLAVFMSSCYVLLVLPNIFSKVLFHPPLHICSADVYICNYVNHTNYFIITINRVAPKLLAMWKHTYLYLIQKQPSYKKVCDPQECCCEKRCEHQIHLNCCY